MSEIDVQAFVRPDGTWFFRIGLYSKKRKSRMGGSRLMSTMDVEGLADKLPYRVKTAGGALAEYQCEQYGDVHDPGECADGALEAYCKLVSDLENKVRKPVLVEDDRATED